MARLEAMATEVQFGDVIAVAPRDSSKVTCEAAYWCRSTRRLLENDVGVSLIGYAKQDWPH